MGSGKTELKSLQCVLVAWPKLHGLCPVSSRGKRRNCNSCREHAGYKDTDQA